MKTLTMLLLLSLLAISVWASDDDAKHEAMTNTLIEEVWNKGNMEKAGDVFAADIVRNMPKSWEPNKIEGIDAMKEYIMSVHKEYETIKVTLQESVAHGKTMALRWHLTGKLADGGKEIAFGGLSFIHLNDDGKIAKEWIIWDTHDVMEQLGMHMMMEEHGEHSTEKHE